MELTLQDSAMELLLETKPSEQALVSPTPDRYLIDQILLIMSIFQWYIFKIKKVDLALVSVLVLLLQLRLVILRSEMDKVSDTN